MNAFRLAVWIMVLAFSQGCANLCGDNSTREGVWGITLRCQTATRTANVLSVKSGRERKHYAQISFRQAQTLRQVNAK